MKRNIFYAVIILICSVFVITLAATGCVMYSDYKTGIAAAEKRFEKLFYQTEDAISKYSVPTKEFMKEFNKAIGSPEYYYSVSLQNAGQEIYTYPADEPRGSKFFTVTKSSRITEGSSLDLTLTVCIYTLPSDIIFSRIRIAFIIILATTLASSLCLFYLYLSDAKDMQKTGSGKKPYARNEFEKEDETDYDEENFDIDFDFNEDDNFNFPEEEADTVETDGDEQETGSAELHIDEESKSEAETQLSEPEQENDFHVELESGNESDAENSGIVSGGTAETPSEQDSAPDTENSGEENTTPSETENALSNETAAASENNEANTEQSEQTAEEESAHDLFSSATGLCFEKYLTTRLDSELARSSSGELDLSLILIRVPGNPLDDACGAEICKTVLDIFHYRDMLFEYKKDGIAVIFSNADIDKAMESSETMYTEICAILNKYEKKQKPVFGIASRSLRFIAGERLITEAEQALIHAGEDAESPIIAFRVNPEKYRQYIASKETE